MCNIIKVSQKYWHSTIDTSIDNELETLQEFVDFFKADIELYKAFGYVTLDNRACLCQIDLHKWFFDLNQKIISKKVVWEFMGTHWEIKKL